MGFETYVPKRGPSGSKSEVRILKSGDLSISGATHAEWFDGANYVELLFDPKGKKVGLRPRKRPTKASYKLRESPQGGDRRYVSGGQFLETYGISVGKATSYESKWNEREALVEFAVK